MTLRRIAGLPGPGGPRPLWTGVVHDRPGPVTDAAAALGTVGVMDHLTIETGPLVVDDHGSTVTVTPHMLAALERIRASLITTAQLGATTTYKALAIATGGAYSVRGFGRALDVLAVDCRNRGEPSLGALVVRSGRKEKAPGAVGGDTARERSRCYERWATTTR